MKRAFLATDLIVVALVLFVIAWWAITNGILSVGNENNTTREPPTEYEIVQVVRLATEAFQTGDCAKGIQTIRPLAEQDVVEAQFLLGDSLLRKGCERFKNLASAELWLQKAAVAGHAEAKRVLANLGLEMETSNYSMSKSAVSIDCQKASSEVEVKLCSNPQKEALERLLDASYRQTLARVSDPLKSQLRKSQRAWLSERKRACPGHTIQCLSAYYPGRIQELALFARETSFDGTLADLQRLSQIERELTLAAASIVFDDNHAALEHAYNAIRLEPTIAESYATRAGVWLGLNEPKKAIEDYNRAILLNPLLAESYAQRASLRIRYGHTQSALDDTEMALLLNPSNLQALIVRGLIRSSLDHQMTACADLRRAILNIESRLQRSTPTNGELDNLLSNTEGLKATRSTVENAIKLICASINNVSEPIEGIEIVIINPFDQRRSTIHAVEKLKKSFRAHQVRGRAIAQKISSEIDAKKRLPTGNTINAMHEHLRRYHLLWGTVTEHFREQPYVSQETLTLVILLELRIALDQLAYSARILGLQFGVPAYLEMLLEITRIQASVVELQTKILVPATFMTPAPKKQERVSKTFKESYQESGDLLSESQSILRSASKSVQYRDIRNLHLRFLEAQTSVSQIRTRTGKAPLSIETLISDLLQIQTLSENHVLMLSLYLSTYESGKWVQIQTQCNSLLGARAKALEQLKDRITNSDR